MDPGAHHRPAFDEGPQGRGNQRADRCEDERGIERLGRRGIRIAGPHSAQRQSETLGFGIPTPGERVHLAALVARDLGHDVGRGPEAVDPEPSRIARQAQRAVPDEPGAQERRGLDVGDSRREGEAEARIGQGVLGVAAVLPVAGESGRVAEVLGAPLAIATDPAGGPEPRHPHAIAQSEPGH